MDRRVIQQCVTLLRNADDRVYNLLMAELVKYVGELTVAVTECNPAEVMEARGRAQAARKFVELLTPP